jgi:BirA family biotin operon repressor/biotin-[acetyl-CoA-carboxylase] ligase
LTRTTTQGAAHATWRVDRLEAVDSTNEEARRRALGGDPGRLWIVADEQLAGRGRRGRSWVSPKGNLHASALLIDPCAQARSAQLGFVAGVALARAAEDVDAAVARLKWPNDLIIRGAKCAGLLVEGATLPDRQLACIVGIGVNCAHAPEGVGYPTALLRRSDGTPVAAADLFERLAARFEETLSLWARGDGFAAVREAWLARAAGVGTTVRIDRGAGRREGAFEGLDADGRLLFREGDRIEAIEAADLWISPDANRESTQSAPGGLEGEGPA